MEVLQVEQVFRPERNDVFAFFVIKKTVGENDEIIPVKQLVEEVTVNQLIDRIHSIDESTQEAEIKRAEEQTKIDMINNLQNGSN